MKILHTSDWHLGISATTGMTLEEDQRFFINEIKKIIEEKNVEAVLIAGDIFDRSIASPAALKLYDETMKMLCADMGVKVLLIAGNHDGAERISSCRDLLETSGLYICGRLSEKPCVVSLGDVDVYMIPWITTERVRFAFPDRAEEVTSMESAYRVVLDACRDCFIPGRKNICVSHAFVSGAETCVSDRAAEVGHATQIGAGVFDGFDYVALGHIHGPQNVTDKIRYCGTPMIYSFGKEESQEKSVTLIDTDSMERTIIPVKSLRKRITLKDTYDVIYAADYPEDIKNAYVRLEVTDRYVGREMANELIARYPHFVELKSKRVEMDEVSVSMTIDELEELSMDPSAVFEKYYEEIVGEEPSGHILELFKAACEQYAKEVSEE